MNGPGGPAAREMPIIHRIFRRHVLEDHLDEEEHSIVPLIDRHLTEPEWKDVGERGFEKFTPAQRWIATGQLVEVATPEETALMLAQLPPPVKVLWHLIGKRKYRRYIRQVRGGQLVRPRTGTHPRTHK